MRVFALILGLGLCLLAGCGGGGGGSSAPGITITVSPTSAIIAPGGTQTFTATVTHTTNTAVTWSVQEGAAGGTITSAGLYTAPATPGNYHILVVSQADPTKNAVIPVGVPLTVAISISPTSATVAAGQSVTFTATVTGTSNTAVTWSVREGAVGGTITSAGVYTPVAASGTFHVVAISQADPTKQAVATVVVQTGSASGTVN